MDLQSNGSNLFNLRQSDSHSSLRNCSTGLSQCRSTTAAEAGWLEQWKSRWSHNRELQDTTKPGASRVKACHGRKTMRNSSLFPKHADHHHTLQSYNPTVQKHCICNFISEAFLSFRRSLRYFSCAPLATCTLHTSGPAHLHPVVRGLTRVNEPLVALCHLWIPSYKFYYYNWICVYKYIHYNIYIYCRILYLTLYLAYIIQNQRNWGVTSGTAQLRHATQGVRSSTRQLVCASREWCLVSLQKTVEQYLDLVCMGIYGDISQQYREKIRDQWGYDL